MSHLHPQMKIRLEPEVKSWLKDKAVADERSQTWLINRLVKEAMRREQRSAR